MSAEEFWRCNPRTVNLVVEGYIRRRAWAGFHAGYGLHAKDAKIEHLMGRPAAKPPMSIEQMMANLDAHATKHNTRVAGSSE